MAMPENISRIRAKGSFSLTLKVRSSTAASSVMRAASNCPDPDRTIQRRMLGMTSAVVTGVSSVKRSPSRNSKV